MVVVVSLGIMGGGVGAAGADLVAKQALPAAFWGRTFGVPTFASFFHLMSGDADRGEEEGLVLLVRNVCDGVCVSLRKPVPCGWVWAANERCSLPAVTRSAGVCRRLYTALVSLLMRRQQGMMGSIVRRNEWVGA